MPPYMAKFDIHFRCMIRCVVGTSTRFAGGIRGTNFCTSGITNSFPESSIGMIGCKREAMDDRRVDDFEKFYRIEYVLLTFGRACDKGAY